MGDSLRIGVAGLGTVGAETVRVLAEKSDLLAARAGRGLRVTAIAARDRAADRGFDLADYAWCEDARALAERADVDVVVELIGGSDGIAAELVGRALAAGKPVVTANKALIAHHGATLARAAETSEAAAAGVSLACEAAVAGGIPIIKTIREGLAANRLRRVYGILNGTCNYILTVMRETGRAFDDVLADAQALGYAEADPAFDIDGVDAAHKLAILSALAFGVEIDFGAVHIEGVRHVSPTDFEFAEELGYRIKLLGIAEYTEPPEQTAEQAPEQPKAQAPEQPQIQQRVRPCMVPISAQIAQVDGVFNAVVAEGDSVGTILSCGPGAGAGPTASAVIADLVDIARGRAAPLFGLPANTLTPAIPLGVASLKGHYYLRLTVIDQPGVLADLTAVFRDEKVSVASMIQRGHAPSKGVPLVLTTHNSSEEAVRRAVARIATLTSVLEEPRIIPIEAI